MAAKKRVVKPSQTSSNSVHGDFLISLTWAAVSSVFAEVADYLHPITGLDHFTLNITILILGLICITPLCNAWGGAIFNPAMNMAFITSGRGSAGFNLLRAAAQVAGALAGSHVARKVVPLPLQRMFPTLCGGLRKGVTLPMGMAAEGALSFASNLLILVAIDSPNKRFAFWAPLAATVAIVYVGGAFTGPSLNPAMAFAWDWHYQAHTPGEHWLVFWAAPCMGALTAGAVYAGMRMGARAKAAATKAKKRSGKAKMEEDGNVKEGGVGSGKKEQGRGAVGETVATATAATTSLTTASQRRRVQGSTTNEGGLKKDGGAVAAGAEPTGSGEGVAFGEKGVGNDGFEGKAEGVDAASGAEHGAHRRRGGGGDGGGKWQVVGGKQGKGKGKSKTVKAK